MPLAETVANVVLRIPSLMMLELLYKWDVGLFAEQIRARNEEMLIKYKYVLWNVYYLGHLLGMVVLVLPLQHLVKLYLYLLTALLLYVGHQTCRDYVLREVESGYDGAVFLDLAALQRFVSTLTGQLLVSSFCSYFMKSKPFWLFSAHLLPLLARLCMVPLGVLLLLNKLTMVFTTFEVIYFLLRNMFVPYHLAKSAYREIVQSELYGILGLGIMLWNQFAVPVLFTVFWLVLFAAEIYFYLSSQSQTAASNEGLIFVFLTSVAGCCVTPYSMIGLTFAVSRLSLGLLALCKFYLQGYSGFLNGNLMHRGVTEGVTFLLLALQTDLIDLHILQRTFLLSIILFIIVASILQSMLEITDPVVLALGASRNRSFWKHFRAVTMCLFLLVFPSFMAYKIAQFFEMDFWLLIIVSSSALTSLQVTGTLFIYGLFLVESLRREPIEDLEDVIYYVNSGCRVLEFLVAVCVVTYGGLESVLGEWSWMGASVIIVHSYFNVWLRARAGWNSFLLRREAAKKISALPQATAQQLQDHSDVCAICYQVMRTAIITLCGHYYHSSCLRRWLYVQKTCPMCHQLIKPSSPLQEPPPPARDEEPDLENPVAADEAASAPSDRLDGPTEASGSANSSSGDGKPLREDQGSSPWGQEDQEPPGLLAPKVGETAEPGAADQEVIWGGEQPGKGAGKESPDHEEAPPKELNLAPGPQGGEGMDGRRSGSPIGGEDPTLLPDPAGMPPENTEPSPFSERDGSSGTELGLQEEG
ncbi:RING finger protein 145-like isoform X2 [Pristis pectinata]|uniref:RING finger protein 145-like isoform X2 n=1 Tax=Pristis pectinata TaxID=685728 RepID=UPI00223E0EB0|nr:RING finger protein 145-like isoform X2 [Pristis pectinata]